MNTVRKYVDPHNPWWRYVVTLHTLSDGWREMPFATAQGAEDYIETRFPGVAFTWDTRQDTEEQRDRPKFESLCRQLNASD